jgi:hypothetical protein
MYTVRKFLCGIAILILRMLQYSIRTNGKEKYHSDATRPRWLSVLQIGIRAPDFNTQTRWVEQVEIEEKFHRVLKLQYVPGF